MRVSYGPSDGPGASAGAGRTGAVGGRTAGLPPGVAPAAPLAPGTTGLVGPGAYIPSTRGPSSKTTLMIAWEHATYTEKSVPKPKNPTAASVDQRVRRALTAEEALVHIAGADRRPLLVLRECLSCSGTEDALMSSKEDNERTYLLARWFHCVKLSPDVLEDDHPFRNLFPGEKPAHLFIANADGSSRHDLEGEHARSELWEAMEGAIAANYKGSHETALRKLAGLLDELDEIDRSLADLETRFELALAADGADSKKFKKLRAQLDERRVERAELLASAVRVSALEPKPAAPEGSH